MDKLTAIKIKYDDGTYSDEIPVSVLSENVEWDSTHTLVDVLGSIDVDVTGTIQDQISQLFNEKVSATQLSNYVASQLNEDVSTWLNNNVDPVGSAVIVDSSLTVSGAAGDAKAVGDEIADLKGNLKNVNANIFDSATRLSVPGGNISYNWKLDGTGKCVSATGFKLLKIEVVEGTMIWIKASADSEGVYQFQNVKSVPSSLPNNGLIGAPQNAAIDELVMVPNGATWLIISAALDNMVNGVYTYKTKYDNIDLLTKTVGIYESTFETKGGSQHSSSTDQILVNIEQGKKIMLTASAEIDASFDIQWFLYFEDETSQQYKTNINTSNIYTATKTIKAVGVYIGAQTVDHAVRIELRTNISLNDIDSKDYLKNYLSTKNIIGMLGGVLYPVFIPSGTTLVMSTKDGAAIGQSTLNFYTFDASGNQLQYWNFFSTNSSRTFTTSQDAYFVGWNINPAKEVQVEINDKTDYQPYAVNITDNEVIKRCLTTIVPVSRSKCQAFAALMYGDPINTVDAPHPCESFLFFTDPHTMQGTGWESRNAELIGQIQKYYDSTPTTFCLSGGDWIGNSDLPADACYKMGYINGFMHSMFENCHLLVGNHDTNYQGKKDSESERYTTRLSNDSISDLWYQSKKAYYSFKDGITKFYCLDTGIERQQLTDFGNYGWEQATWFATALLTEDSEHIAIAAHILYTDLPTNSDICPIMDEVLDIAKAYNDRDSISVNGNMFNFANATGKIDFCVCGHSHGDYNGIVNGIPYFLTINAGALPNQASFDLVLVDYSGGKIECIRVGSGSNRTISLETGNLIT